MTNEELMIEFQNGNDSALDKLYLKNQSLYALSLLMWLPHSTVIKSKRIPEK